MSISLPIIGQIYNYFDDGKIRESRKIPVIITEIIPFNEIDEETLIWWKEEIEEIDWVYAKETNYFIKGELLDDDLKNSNQHKVIFVRTLSHLDYDWFSMGWWAGILDIDGSLNAMLY